ncbi:MAG: phosphoadenosine phosphosulfate reductase family protein [Firmicutes bacterium]|nr:phosphoadenosine phosphosulfate reductase family protein [Bacillota bacterium]
MQQLDFLNREQYLFDSAIQLLKDCEPRALEYYPKGFIVGYSGGKDSEVLVDIFFKSGVKFMIIHNHTTIDTPETVYHVRKRFREWENRGITCQINYPRMSFWALCLHKKMLPLRICRFCCSELKERNITEYKFATHSFGVRRAESASRKKYRDSIEMGNRRDYGDRQKFHFDNTAEAAELSSCMRYRYYIVNPLAYWPDEIVWRYIESERLDLNPGYARGLKRIGCIGCPMAGDGRIAEFEQYPVYKQNYIRLCDRIIKNGRDSGKQYKNVFNDGHEYFEWWLHKSDDCYVDENQIGFDFGVP